MRTDQRPDDPAVGLRKGKLVDRGRIVPLEPSLTDRPLLNFDRTEDAVILFTKLHNASPDNLLVLNNLAWNLRDSDPDKAMEFAERAQELRPDSPAIKSTMAVIIGDSDSERALRLIREAQRGDPDNPAYGFRNAMVLGEIGRKEEAIVVLRKLLREHPDFEDTSRAKRRLIELDR